MASSPTELEQAVLAIDAREPLPREQTPSIGIAENARLSPYEYACMVLKHSQTSICNSLNSGEDYGNLARFLLSPYREGQNDTRTNQQPIDTDRFVIQYKLQSNVLSPGKQLREERALEAPSDSQSDASVLLFLCGYPSAQWLNALGSKYKIDPAFFHRHLDFLHMYQRGKSSTEHVLPSACRNIFQLHIPSIGYQRAFCEETDTYIDDKRRESATEMERYAHDLGMGHQWRYGDSIIRRHWVHDEECFSIEQLATIYISTWDRNKGTWVGIVWLDAGRDLSSSPKGPWRADIHTHFRPVTQNQAGIALKDHRIRNVEEAPHAPPAAISLPQSISLLPTFYGRSLNAPLMAADPFYALTELFEFAVASELDLLNVIKAKVDGLMLTSDIRDDSPATTLSPSYLLYSHQILEHSVLRVREILEFIKCRRKLKWPHSQNQNQEENAENTAGSLQRDLEYLLGRAEMLRAQCERKMNIMMNTANIAEAKRGVEQARSVFKFTVLASFYVPLSFTTSLFGMNFVQFGTGTLNIWVWAVVSVPVFGLSFLVLFWDPIMIWSWLVWVRNYLK